VKENEFSIRSITPNVNTFTDAAVVLKGAGGEKEIGSSDLKYFIKIN
jgi:hypothetical protein